MQLSGPSETITDYYIVEQPLNDMPSLVKSIRNASVDYEVGVLVSDVPLGPGPVWIDRVPIIGIDQVRFRLRALNQCLIFHACCFVVFRALGDVGNYLYF